MKIEIGSVDTSGRLVWTPVNGISPNGSWVKITMRKRELPILLQQLGISLPSGFFEGSERVQMTLGPPEVNLEPSNGEDISITLTSAPATSPDVQADVKSAPERPSLDERTIPWQMYNYSE